MATMYCSTIACTRTAHGLMGYRGAPLCDKCHLAYERGKSSADDMSSKMLKSLKELTKWMRDSGTHTTKSGGFGSFGYQGTEYSVYTNAMNTIKEVEGGT